jgi:hypothetical protein
VALTSAVANGRLAGVIGISGPYHLGRLRKNPLLRVFYLDSMFPTLSRDLERAFSPMTMAKDGVNSPVNTLLLTASFDFHLNRDADELAAILTARPNWDQVVVQRSKIPKTNHQTIICYMQPRTLPGREHNSATTEVVLDFLARCR